MTYLRRPSSPPPPPEDDDLLSEILLRLPPQPSSLPRANLVCKGWCRLVSDPGFLRRFRTHHRRNPPLLGFFTDDRRGLSFTPTLEPPNRVPLGRFLQFDDGDDCVILGCRHGLVLILNRTRLQVLVWDPVTGDQHRLAFLSSPEFREPVIWGFSSALLQLRKIGSEENALSTLFKFKRKVWMSGEKILRFWSTQ